MSVIAYIIIVKYVKVVLQNITNFNRNGKCKNMKRLLSVCLVLALLLSFVFAVGAKTQPGEDLLSNISVMNYNPSTDYTALMIECLNDGGKYAMCVGAIYEKMRNLKIENMNLTQYKKTYYFDTYSTASEILCAMNSKDESKKIYRRRA